MPVVGTSNIRISNVVKAEDWKEWGFCRTKATVLVATGMTIGSVVKNDGDGTYSWVAAADVATLNADVGVIIDDAIYDVATGDQTIVILNIPIVGGKAVIGDKFLKYADTLTGPQQATVKAALKARGFLIATQV